MASLDYTPLSTKVSFSERMQKNKSSWVVWFGGVMAGILVMWAVIYLVVSREYIGTAIFLVAACIFVVISFMVYEHYGRTIRIQRFMQQNGLSFYTSGRDSVESRSGMLFERGYSRYFADIVVSTAHSFDEIGTYGYTVGSGKNSRSYTRGYVRIKLPRKLPHMILDAKSNNFLGKFSNIDGIGGQKLSLEGDFDTYFTLYAPPEYATDALYVFTPDIMQLLIDAAHKYDCEIIDDNFYIHSDTRFDIAKLSTYEEVLKITDALASKLDRRTDYYADERVGDRELNIVAPQGARLKSGVSVATIITFVAIMLYILFIFMSGN